MYEGFMIHNIEGTLAKPVKCEDCGKITDVIIDHIPEITGVCPACAHKIMRRLFEDLIQYHNRNNKGRHFSLLGVMFHGEELINQQKQHSLSEF